MASPEPDPVEWLLQRGVVTRAQVEECRQACGPTHGATTLLESLVARGYVSSEELPTLLSSPRNPSDGHVPTRPTPPLPLVPRDGAPPPGAPLPSAQQVGHFEILEELGHGGMARVYKARDTRLGRVVAVKVLTESASPDALARFQREARLAARLRHPRIVQIHDVGEWEGRPFIAMDLVHGKTLGHYLRAHPGDLRGVARILKQVAEALAYAHEQGVVHRDIKPENILLDEEGRAEVSDFGLARELGETTRMTVSGAVLGTPAYMAPEQAEGAASLIGPATDIYGVGAVLYEALAGRPPFQGAAIEVVFKRVLDGDIVPPSALHLQVPRDLEVICLKCLEREPSRRYASARALADDLERYLSGGGILARPPSAIYRIRRWVVKRRGAVLLLALGLAAAAGFLWVSRLAEVRGQDLADALRRARACEARGDLDGAKAGYEAAAALARGDEAAREEARAGLGHVEALQRAKAQAEEEALRLLEAGRPALDDANRYLYQKDASYDELQRRVGAGKKLIERAVGGAPQVALGHHLLGRAWRLLGWDDRAEACWRDALRLDPKLGVAHFHLGMLFLERAVIARADIRPGPSDPEREDRAAALLHNARTELDAAAALSWEGEDELSRELLGVAQDFVAGREEEVIDRARAEVARFGRREGCEWFLLLEAISQADRDDRTRTLQEALSICPHDALALWYLGCARFGAGDLGAARDLLDQAIAIRPRFSDAYNDRAVVRKAKGDTDGVLADLDQAISIGGGSAEAYFNRGLARTERNEVDAAMADFTRALDLKPRWPEALADRAALHKAKGELTEAIRDDEEALAAAPSDWSLRAWVGKDLAEAKWMEQRVPWVAAVVRAEKRVHAGDCAGARPELEEALARAGADAEKDPDARYTLVMAHYDLACCLVRMAPEAGETRARQLDGAFEHLRKALALGLSDLTHLKSDPDLAPLHGDPRWDALLQGR